MSRQKFKNRERKDSETQKEKGNREDNTPLKLIEIKNLLPEIIIINIDGRQIFEKIKQEWNE